VAARTARRSAKHALESDKSTGVPSGRLPSPAERAHEIDTVGARGFAGEYAGITLLWSRDPDDTALWINRLALRHARRQAKIQRPGPTVRPNGAPSLSDPRLGLLSAVPGISIGTARTLLDRFGSIQHLIAAGPEQWADVDGIGAVRAHALATTLLAETTSDQDVASRREAAC
jgi:ERCC4-type nuclease